MGLTKPKLRLEDFADMINFEEKKQDSNNILEMPFDKMLSFPNHKFKLYEGLQLEDMIKSIKELGILLPIILWHNENNEYIILSGHNRKNAGELAGLLKSPVIVRENLSYDDAVLIVTETNLRQRSFSDLSHSERAYCLAEHYEAIKSQGKRTDLLKEIETLLNTHETKENNTSSEFQTKLRTDEKLGQDYGLSKDKVAKYIRISKLDIMLINMLDDSTIGFTTAYTLSFIEDDYLQKNIADFITSENYKIDIKKAELLRQYYENKKLTELTISEIISGEKTKKPKSDKPKPIKVKDTIIKKYFKDMQNTKEIEEIIEKALKMYFAHNENEV